ncbi:DoxX family protein [uncultured Erythrobacter sp.]|uniref:DoxX family protein n=1 Tax=uncultured Erythrobacter sp. TaxID=263913 RepID=UPI0026248C0D|nr:DoxX family protein [uncultured Erythrobacter sp.]
MRLIENVTYWIATALMGALMLFAVQMYLRNPGAIAGVFESYSYPGYVVYPLAGAKAVAFLVIALNRWRNLKDIAYGAFFINLVMATYAHINAGETPIHAYVGLIAVPLSYILSNRVRGEPSPDAFLLRARDVAR